MGFVVFVWVKQQKTGPPFMNVASRRERCLQLLSQTAPPIDLIGVVFDISPTLSDVFYIISILFCLPAVSPNSVRDDVT